MSEAVWELWSGTTPAIAPGASCFPLWSAYALMDEKAAGLPPGSEGVLYIPQLGGQVQQVRVLA